MVRVLIADNDEDLLEMVTLMLTVLPDAGAKPDRWRPAPDILLVDIFLGDSDGRQPCKQLKHSSTYAGLQVFLYSAGEISNASIEELEADYFLRKPFEMSHLVNRIHESLKK